MSMPDRAPSGSAVSWSKLIHYAVVILLIVGGVAYWMFMPPSVNPLSDPLAAEAMALVQTHRAQQAPTIRQAISDRAKSLSDQGKGVSVREWRVEREPSGTYLVRVSIREQATIEWFERNYLWRVDVAQHTVTPLTLPASTLMPSEETGHQTM